MIGQLLVATRAISQDQLDQALDEQQRTGALLGDVLVAMKFVSGENLAQAIAQEARVPYDSLEQTKPDPEAAALVSETRARETSILPLSRTDDRLRVAIADPFDLQAIDDIQRETDLTVEAVCAPRAAIIRLLDVVYGSGKDKRFRDLIEEAAAHAADPFGEIAAEDAPVVRLVDILMEDAVAANASDLHVEPEESLIRLRRRVDGVLTEVGTLPKELLLSMVSRLKVMSSLDIAEQRLPQEGRITRTIFGRSVDFRVSTFPTVFGEKVAIRVLEKEKLIRGLGELGLNRRNLALIKDLLSRSRGIILVTGPTGAGKTTTLYSALNILGGRHLNIMTVEDPVEYEFPLFRQTQVRTKAGLTFATAIRSLLRQDPDVVMIGEIRDPETAQLAVRAALSGILVMTTLHTQDTAGAMPRLMDMGVEPYLLASAVIGVVAQRLVRKICLHCKAPVDAYPPDVLAKAGLLPDHGITFYRGAGCDQCDHTGYRGRTGVAEILMIDNTIHELIRQRADSRQIKEAASRMGFKSLLDDALSKAVLGQTTLEDVLRVAYE